MSECRHIRLDRRHAVVRLVASKLAATNGKRAPASSHGTVFQAVALPLNKMREGIIIPIINKTAEN
jgi:hypothetical protein